ncbi:MAG: Gfo/Idh/MocA family oxidoreductase [Bacteroidetes bacterium]|nr:Gfo/Idh/MocA family oxidoreductase [Bacteroidota bacterium]
MDKIRFGIIGLGIMGQNYLDIYKTQNPYTEVAAVSNRSTDRLNSVAEKFGIPERDRYADYKKILDRKDIDAVVIATPDFAHTQMVLDALSAGKHVLVEKPLTISTKEADQIVEAVNKTKLKLQVSYNHRWLSSYYEAKMQIQSGEIGKPLLAYARKNDTIFVSTEMINWASKTNSTYFLSAHDVDLVRWYFDSEPVEARGYGIKEVLVKKGIDTYDLIQGQVKFQNGSIATFESGWIYPNTFPTIVDSFVEVIGSSGHIHLDRKYESIEVSSQKGFSYPKTFTNKKMFGKIHGSLKGCLDAFADCIINNTDPIVSAYDGRQVTAILEAIVKSADNNGETIKIK